MSKKFQKFMLFTVAVAAAGSALIYLDKKRKTEEEPLFEDEDSCSLATDVTSEPAPPTSFATQKNSRSYINLV